MRIALLTPYTGGNLGDAAIQEAVILNIRERYPEAHVYLVSLVPELTTQLHDVPSFPLTQSAQWEEAPVATANRANGVDGTGQSQTPQMRQGALLRRAKAAIKSSGRLYSVLKPMHEKTRPAYDELRHIRRVYRFLRSVDLLIVSGGGQLDEYWGGPWGHPYALFKWGLLAKRAGSRFIILSVGTCALESNVSAFFIRQALSLADYRSYRDRTSKELLSQLEFTRNDRVYPDLAFSYADTQGLDCNSPTHEGRVVGVSPIAYLAPCGWPEQNSAVFKPYFEAFVAFVRILLKRGDSVILFSSDGPDRQVVADMVGTLAKENDPDLAARLTHPRTHTLPELLAQLAQVDYVVASRLHGVLLSHRHCLPVLAVSYDRKVDTYMEDVGLSEFCLDIHDVTTDALVRGFDALTERSESIRSTLRATNERYAHDLQLQYDAVLGRRSFKQRLSPSRTTEGSEGPTD